MSTKLWGTGCSSIRNLIKAKCKFVTASLFFGSPGLQNMHVNAWARHMYVRSHLSYSSQGFVGAMSQVVIKPLTALEPQLLCLLNLCSKLWLQAWWWMRSPQLHMCTWLLKITMLLMGCSPWCVEEVDSCQCSPEHCFLTNNTGDLPVLMTESRCIHMKAWLHPLHLWVQCTYNLRLQCTTYNVIRLNKPQCSMYICMLYMTALLTSANAWPGR